MVRKSLAACLLLLSVYAHPAWAKWPFFAEDGRPPRGTPEYFESRAGEPPGTRQKYKYGKLWPPFPRPVGEKQPLIHTFHDAHYWPYPYVCADRASVRAFQQTQIMNGWLAATTLYDYHFDPATQELNSSGREHLQWILSHAPDMHRETHVAVATSPELTTSRLMSVEREVARLSGAAESIPVLPRVADPLGRPAFEVNEIFRQAQSNMPAPVIAPGTTASGGGSSSGSGG